MSSSTLGVGYAVTGIYDQEKPFLFTEGTLIIPAYTDKINIDIFAQSIGAIQEIKIAGKAYELAASYVPEQGEYYYSPKDRILVINPIDSVREGDNIYYSGLTEGSQTIRTTQIIDNVPDLFHRWNIYGSAEFSSNFLGYPIAIFNFLVNSSFETSILNTFAPNRSFSFYGKTYEARQIQVNQIPDNNKIQVTINFQGKHSPKGKRNPLDRV